jgi:hypothetical protein
LLSLQTIIGNFGLRHLYDEEIDEVFQWKERVGNGIVATVKCNRIPERTNSVTLSVMRTQGVMWLQILNCLEFMDCHFGILPILLLRFLRRIGAPIMILTYNVHVLVAMK